ncbi:MAG: hypothetical protein ABJB86_12055 [Bacteroidota bacterium]
MKKYIGGIAAIIVAIAASAFTMPEKAHPDAMQWYVLTNGTDPSIAGNYTLNSTTPPGQDPGCPTPHSSAVCSVKANPGTGNHPSTSDVAAIKSASNNFTTAAGNLEYRP